VLIACVFLRGYVVPALFGKMTWDSYDDLKKRKLVGFVVKITVRISCLVQLLVLVVPHFNMSSGLFAQFNVKTANRELVEDKIVTTCAESGMTLRDAAAMRAWTFTRDDMMAVMVWELAFIPELPADAWAHHIFVILGVALGSDPQILGSNASLQPIIDGNAFFLVLGAALAAGVESAVLMYHLSAPDASKQASWMIRSIAVQTTLVLVLFLALPFTMVFMHIEQLCWLTAGICAVLALLAGVEAKMIIVKWAIVKHSRRKARQMSITVAQAAEEGRSQPLVSQSFQEGGAKFGSHGSFHHDMGKEVEACSTEDEQQTVQATSSQLSSAVLVMSGS